MAPNALPDNVFELEEPSMQLQSKPNRPTTPNKSVSEHSDLQSAWDESMKGVGGLGLPHKNCAVLLINWEKDADDLDTGKEVNDLEAVFKGLYNYDVTKRQLLGKGKSPQIQVQKILVDFVFEHDDESTLLIIYYAGHGVPGKVEGGGHGGLYLAGQVYFCKSSSFKSLLFSSNRQPRTKTNPKNSIVWDEAEMIIKRTKGDVLVIFDCCHAGVLAKGTRSVSDRSFEFLAACGANEVTAMPSDASFTSALIWSLRLLATKSSFTTHQLLRKINENAPHFPREQHALIMERGEDETSCVRKLVLAPLPKPGEKDERKFAPENGKPKDLIKHYLDLRFFYDKPPSKDEVLFLSESLKNMIANEKITVRHIGWLRMTDIARNAADKWKRRATIKGNVAPAASRWAQKFAAAARRQSDINSPITPPPSDSGHNDSSTASSPETLRVKNIETSNIGNVDTSSSIGNIENMNVAHSDNINLNIGNISTASMRRLIMGGPHYRYRLEVFIVGLVVLVLECFHRLRPREAPAIVLLSFCAYAWYMSSIYHKKGISGESSGISSYLPLVIGGISLSVCWKLLFTDRGNTT